MDTYEPNKLSSIIQDMNRKYSSFNQNQYVQKALNSSQYAFSIQWRFTDNVTGNGDYIGTPTVDISPEFESTDECRADCIRRADVLLKSLQRLEARTIEIGKTMDKVDSTMANTESKMDFLQSTEKNDFDNQKEIERSQKLIQELRSVKASCDMEFRSNGLQLHLTEWAHRRILNNHHGFGL